MAISLSTSNSELFSYKTVPIVAVPFAIAAVNLFVVNLSVFSRLIYETKVIVGI